MRALIFDPFAGIAGDMVLGALVDLGLPAELLHQLAASIGVPGVEVRVTTADRSGIACGRVEFVLPHEHAHRHLHHVLELVDRSSATDTAKARAGRIFRRLAEAEAEIHGIPVEKVHFHEVGALDAVLDVLCTAAGVEALGFDRFFTRPIALGSGWIDIAHGRFPVPAPATAKLLQGLPVSETSLPGECTTPTGAAILAALVEAPRPPAEFILAGSGYGAGTRNPEDRPNCLRLLAVELDEAAERLFVVQADVDDLSPEYVPPAQDALIEAGAVDATVGNVAMKKGRPGLRFEALVPEAQLAGVLDVLFRSTSTIGARYWPVERPALERSEERFEWRGQSMRRKRVRLPGGEERTKVEYEDVVRAARQLGTTAYEVSRAVEREAGPASAE